MNIKSINFIHINNKLFLIVTYEDDTYKKFYVKNKYKPTLLSLLINITILDKYN